MRSGGTCCSPQVSTNPENVPTSQATPTTVLPKKYLNKPAVRAVFTIEVKRLVLGSEVAGDSPAPSAAIKSGLTRQILFSFFFHQLPQRPIDPRLVAAPALLKPGNHIGIKAQRYRLLDRPV
jgi:hypothetical protein